MNKAQIRNRIGRGKFSIATVADEFGLTYHTARNQVLKLQDAGTVAVVGQHRTGQRGRPVDQFRLV